MSRLLRWTFAGQTPHPQTMPIGFEESESQESDLWDYGWFSVTRFRFTPSDGPDPSDADVIRELTLAPIYQRSFCSSPDPWGASIERHGPFHIQAISPDWFRQISTDQLMRRITEEIDTAGFDGPPSHDQMSKVADWADNVTHRGDAIFLMHAPDDEQLRVEWAGIWSVFTEFICVSRNHRELTVAVIGYD